MSFQLIWILVGPEAANNVVDTKKNKAGPNSTFGQCRYGKTPDGVILAFLECAAAAKAKATIPTLPSMDTTIHSLYLRAPSEHLDKLHKV